MSRRIDVPASRVLGIIHGNRNITADTALRLGQFFGTGPELWMNLQKAYAYDLDKAKSGNRGKNSQNSSLAITGSACLKQHLPSRINRVISRPDITRT
ncbi:MAG: HigA family addiction module antidote protein [Halioglobus sp.]|nr:HigA family addiction module antidote protein [Halioglobus sp.]